MKMIRRYKKTLAMSAAALGLLAGLTVESSMAYFTTYVSAGGSHQITLGAESEIIEDVSDMTKHINLRNDSEQNECFVRLKVFYGDGITVEYIDVEQTGKWALNESDGYWYYNQVLAPGELTSKLDVKIDTTGLIKDKENMTEGQMAEYIKDKFNVVVIQECTPARYGDDGEPYADWSTTYSGYTTVDNTQGEGAGN